MLILLVDTQQLLYKSLFTFGKQFTDPYKAVIYGTLTQVRTIVKNTNPDHLLFCWDSKDSIRKDISKDYKAKRKYPEELDFERLFIAKDRLKDIFDLMEWQDWEIEGLEADDLIANCVHHYNYNKLIVSSDQDLYQLLSDTTSMYDSGKKVMYTALNFIKDYDIDPDEWVFVKAIAGCGGDNVIGIKGIGEKRAIDYIKNGKKSKYYAKVKEHWNKVGLNMKLVSLPLVEHIPPKLKEMKFDDTIFIDICQMFGFKSFIDNINTWRVAFRG